MCDTHCAVCREAELTVSILLESCRHERCRGVHAAFLFGQALHFVRLGVLGSGGEFSGIRSVDPEHFPLGLTGGWLKVSSFSKTLVVYQLQISGEGAFFDSELSPEIPVFGFDENPSFLLTFYHELDGRGLDPTSGEVFCDLTPKDW